MMAWRRLITALFASSVLVLLGAGLNGCLDDSTDAPLVLVEEHGHRHDDEPFSGTFSGELTKTQNNVDTVNAVTLTLTTASPLSGTLTLQTAPGTVVGTAAEASAAFAAAFRGDCPGTMNGSLTRMDSDETLALNAVGQDCLGVFTLSGVLLRHESHPWEWPGAFELAAAETYTWVAQQVDGAYAAPTMLIAIVPTSEASGTGIEAAEMQAEALYGSTAQDITAGVTMTTDVLYQLVFDPQSAATRFSLAVPADGAYVIFTEHVPTEFEATSHYLRNAAGEDVEPVAQEPPEDDHDHDHDHNG